MRQGNFQVWNSLNSFITSSKQARFSVSTSYFPALHDTRIQLMASQWHRDIPRVFIANWHCKLKEALKKDFIAKCHWKMKEKESQGTMSFECVFLAILRWRFVLQLLRRKINKYRLDSTRCDAMVENVTTKWKKKLSWKAGNVKAKQNKKQRRENWASANSHKQAHTHIRQTTFDTWPWDAIITISNFMHNNFSSHLSWKHVSFVYRSECFSSFYSRTTLLLA